MEMVAGVRAAVEEAWRMQLLGETVAHKERTGGGWAECRLADCGRAEDGQKGLIRRCASRGTSIYHSLHPNHHFYNRLHSPT